MLLLFLQLTSFIAFAEELDSLHTPARLHPPAKAPHHHQHHHNLSPTPTHTHLHPPHPAKPPTHHHHHHPHVHAPVHKPLPVHAPTSNRHPHHHYAPTPAPVHKPFPIHAPTPNHHLHHHHAPAPSPVRTPLHQIPHPRRLLAVQGVVYVKSCKHAGDDTLLGAKSLHGSNDISSFGAHKCNVVLVSAPNRLKPSNLHGGIVGAVLKAKKSFMSKGHPFILYNVGPLAFEPKCTH